MSHRNAPAMLAALDVGTSEPWSLDRLTRGARRTALMLVLYVALPACWYIGIANDISRGLWNWVVLDVLLVVPGVIRGAFALLG